MANDIVPPVYLLSVSEGYVRAYPFCLRESEVMICELCRTNTRY